MKTALHDRHCALGAKMVDFCGWEMPIQYKGIIVEHQAVREAVGMFDVSHMGRILIEGPDAEKLLDYLSTNKITGKPNLSATYTVWPHEQRGSVDDVIVYKQDNQHFFVIVNAANREKDLKHLIDNRKNLDVKIQDCYLQEGILAVQGPKAIEVFAKIIPDVKKIKPMTFLQIGNLILSGTGYTGAGGFEVFGPHQEIVKLWDELYKQGVEPVGLGARDTLRLEMGYALYGHELSDTISANESVSAWTLKWNKENFIGKEPMLALEKSLHKRFSYGIALIEKGVAREGYEVLSNENVIGKVTSGTQSPTLKKAIAIILVEVKLEIGDIVEIKIRQNRVKAQVVELPFIKKKVTA